VIDPAPYMSAAILVALIVATTLAHSSAVSSELWDAAACPRWTALMKQVAIDRDVGVADAVEHRKIAEIVAADRAKPQPFLVHDNDDEFYLWITVAQIYEHPWYTSSKVEEMVSHDCQERLDHQAPPGSAPSKS
jgi:hypothetical protein